MSGRARLAEVRDLPSPAAPGEAWATTTQVAEHLGVSERTVRRWVARGCPALRVGPRTVRLQPGAVEHWLRDGAST